MSFMHKSTISLIRNIESTNYLKLNTLLIRRFTYFFELFVILRILKILLTAVFQQPKWVFISFTINFMKIQSQRGPKNHQEQYVGESKQQIQKPQDHLDYPDPSGQSGQPDQQNQKDHKDQKDTKKPQDPQGLEKCCKQFRDILKRFDRYSEEQFIGYKGDSNYTTYCGAFISLLIIALIMTLGINQFIKMINRDKIVSSTNLQNQDTPQQMDISFQDGSPFMFAVLFQNNNSETRKYFDIYVSQIDSTAPDSPINSQLLEPCRTTSFNYNTNTQLSALTLRIPDKGFCPPNNYQFSLGGNSVYQKKLKIQFKKCTSRPDCITDDSFMQNTRTKVPIPLKVTLPYINTVVTPSMIDYTNVYLEDKNTFFMSTQIYQVIEADVAQYSINYDPSTAPFDFKKTEKKAAIPRDFTFKELSRTAALTGSYCRLQFSKSAERYTFNQSFRKIDEVASYIGGLIGSFFAAFFIIKWYAGKAYLISLANQLYCQNDEREIQPANFNFWTYLVVSLKRFKCMKDYQRETNIYKDTIDNMTEEVSIELILRKLNLIQIGLSKILTKPQRNVLYYIDKINLDDMEKTRKQISFLKKYLLTEQIENGHIEEMAYEDFYSLVLNIEEMEKSIKTVLNNAQNGNKRCFNIIKSLSQTILLDIDIQIKEGKNQLTYNVKKAEKFKKRIKRQIKIGRNELSENLGSVENFSDKHL